MKKIIFAAFCLLALTACRQDKARDIQQEAMRQQRDSLDRIIAQKDN